MHATIIKTEIKQNRKDKSTEKTPINTYI